MGGAEDGNHGYRDAPRQEPVVYGEFSRPIDGRTVDLPFGDVECKSWNQRPTTHP
jgi:hypothetical protein